MASLNKVLLMGNLTKNPEIRYTPNGSAVTDFTLAVNRNYVSNGEKKEEVCFVDITVWGKQAESVSKYLQKGSPAFIEGRLHLDRWDDKESGKARSRMKVIAERVQFMGSPKGGGDYSNEGAQGGYSPQSNTPQPYAVTNAPNVPPPMPMPASQPQASAPAPAPATNPAPAGGYAAQPANNAFAPQGGQVAPPAPAQPGAYQGAPQQQQSAPVAPQPSNAFNTNAESEDDIPF